MGAKSSLCTPFLKQCFVTSTVGINLIGHGNLIGFPAVLLPQLQQPGSDIHTSKTMDSWIASSLALTLLIGSFVSAPIMDRHGRKIVQYIVCTSAILGWLITFVARSVEIVLLARIIGGLSLGMMMPLRSTLIGEYTSPKNRAGFLTTVSLTEGSGIFLVHLIGSFLTWRQTAAICLILPITSLGMTFFMPESPSWLVSRGKYEKSRQVFRWLRGDDEDLELEAMIQAKIQLEETSRNEKKLDILRNIRKKEFYKPIILMVHLYAIAILSGATISAAYSTTIIELITNKNVNAKMWMVFLDSERIILNTAAIFIINRVKRRTMVHSTQALCITSLLAIAGYVYCKSYGVFTGDILWIPAVLMIVHMFSISVGMMPLPGVIAGEVFPLQYRGIAGAISLVSISGSMFAVLKTFPMLVESVGISGAYVVYAGILTYCMVVIWFFLPETKGRTLQDIEDEYRGKVKDPEEIRSLRTDINK